MKLLRHDAARTRPRAVLFDLDDTLYAYDGPHRRAMAAVRDKMQRLLSVSAEPFEDAFRRAREEVKRRLGETASAHSRLLYFHRMVEILGLSSQPAIALDLEQTYWRTFLMTARLFPGAEDTLVELRAAGVLLGLVTDLTTQIQFRKLVYFGIDRSFDAVVTSEEVGIDKLGLRPFEFALEKLSLSRDDRVWMVGDAACDVIASKEALNVATFQKVPETGGIALPGVDGTFHDFRAFARWARDALAMPAAKPDAAQ